MKVIRAFCLCWLLMLADGVSAQLVDKVLSVLGEDSVGSVTVARTDSDSIQLSQIQRPIMPGRWQRAAPTQYTDRPEWLSPLFGGLCGRFGEAGIAETTH